MKDIYEKADLIERQEAKNIADPNKVEVSISLEIIKSRLETWLTGSATKEWSRENTAKHAKEVWKYYSRTKTQMLLKLNREEMQSTIAFTTGHGKFKAHLEKINLITDGNCGRKDTSKHIMCECADYAILRLKSVSKIHCALKDYANLDFKTFLDFCNKAYKK